MSRSKINKFEHYILQFGLHTVIVCQTYWPVRLLLEHCWTHFQPVFLLYIEVSHLFAAHLRPSDQWMYRSVLVVWYSDVLVVVAAVMRRVQEVRGLRSQAGAERFVAAQHGRQILGLLGQLLHLLSQGGVFLLQGLTLLGKQGMSVIWNKSVQPSDE